MNEKPNWKQQLYDVIFEADTPSGKTFDIFLLWAIIISVGFVVLESVSEYQAQFGNFFYVVEWTLTIVFLIEYILRIICSQNRVKYIFSFFGIIDLLSILPTFLSLYFKGVQSLIILRAFRLLRVFRVLKLGRYLSGAYTIISALRASRPKIVVFLTAIFTVVLLMGTLMYLIEGEEHGFTSIPKAMYWAIVTMTTVGYGDITPQTSIGQFISAGLMVMGYGIIAVPTGIVTSEITAARLERESLLTCQNCGHLEHTEEAEFCHQCGTKIHR